MSSYFFSKGNINSLIKHNIIKRNELNLPLTIYLQISRNDTFFSYTSHDIYYEKLIRMLGFENPFLLLLSNYTHLALYRYITSTAIRRASRREQRLRQRNARNGNAIREEGKNDRSRARNNKGEGGGSGKWKNDNRSAEERSRTWPIGPRGLFACVTDRPTDRSTNRPSDRATDRPTDRPAGRTNKRTNEPTPRRVY